MKDMANKGSHAEITAGLGKYLELMEQSLAVFVDGVRNYLHRDSAALGGNILSMAKLENDAATLARELEMTLYRRTSNPSVRGDTLRLLEYMSRIILTLNNNLFQFEIERPSIPSELNSDFIKLTDLSSQAVANIIPAAKAYFHSPETTQGKVRRIYFYQKETDRQAKDLKRRVFHDMISLKLSEKVHLRYFALHIEELAALAVKVADQLSVMSIRQQSASLSFKWLKNIFRGHRTEDGVITLPKEGDMSNREFELRLTAKYPRLTAQERKLATLLRLEFNTRQIAGVLNISEKSVEVERHRLRGKMGLERHQNLTDFIKNI